MASVISHFLTVMALQRPCMFKFWDIMCDAPIVATGGLSIFKDIGLQLSSKSCFVEYFSSRNLYNYIYYMNAMCHFTYTSFPLNFCT